MPTVVSHACTMLRASDSSWVCASGEVNFTPRSVPSSISVCGFPVWRDGGRMAASSGSCPISWSRYATSRSSGRPISSIIRRKGWPRCCRASAWRSMISVALRTGPPGSGSAKSSIVVRMASCRSEMTSSLSCTSPASSSGAMSGFSRAFVPTGRNAPETRRMVRGLKVFPLYV